MKHFGLTVVAAASTWLSSPRGGVTAQYCPAFVPLDDTSNLSEDYTKVMLQTDCPNSKKLPKSMHYHIVVSDQTDGIPGLTLTGSQADNLLVPTLTAEAMVFSFSKDFPGTDSAVGAEFTFRSGQVQELDVEGFSDQFFIDDTAGSLQVVRDIGAENVIRIKSASTGTLKISHKGSGNVGFGDSGSVLVEAPNANVEVDINGVEHDIRVKCKTISGTVEGAGDKLVVVSGEVVSIKVSGINNDIELHETQTTGGCDNVVKEGINNDCKDDQVTFEIEPMECQGPANDFIECTGSGAFTTSSKLGLMMMTTSAALVAVVGGAWV